MDGYKRISLDIIVSMKNINYENYEEMGKGYIREDFFFPDKKIVMKTSERKSTIKSDHNLHSFSTGDIKKNGAFLRYANKLLEKEGLLLVSVEFKNGFLGRKLEGTMYKEKKGG